MIIRIQEALRRKLNNLKPLFSGNEEHCISKEVKGNALASNSLRGRCSKGKGKRIRARDRPRGRREGGFLSFLPPAPYALKFPLPLLTPATQIMPTRNNNRRKPICEQAAFWHEVKVVCCLPTPFSHSNDFFPQKSHECVLKLTEL